jgi:hypothetical protein
MPQNHVARRTIPMNNLIRLLTISLIAVAGCGKNDGHDESAAKRAGSAVGEAVTDFASGVGKGVDKQMSVNVELTKALSDKGLSKSVAKSTGIDVLGPDVKKSKGISVYLIAAKAFKAKLVAKALAEDGQEIGRSTVDIDFAADDAKYVTFTFDREMDTQLVVKYVIDAKK